MLWSGHISKLNETLTLSQSSTNFKYLRVGYTCFGHSLFGLYSVNVNNITIREYNCSDDMIAVNFPEITLTKQGTDNRTYKITHRMFIYFGQNSNISDDTENIDADDSFFIGNVYGVGYN